MWNVENRRPSDNREQDASRKSKKGTGISEEANLNYGNNRMNLIKVDMGI